MFLRVQARRQARPANLTIESFINSQGGIASDNSGNEPSLGVQLGYFNVAQGEYFTVGDTRPLPISGTVTANLSNESTIDIDLASTNVYSRRALVVAAGNDLDTAVPLQTDGYRNLNVKVNAGSVTIGSLPAISGTVTVGAMPNGSLTTLS